MAEEWYVLGSWMDAGKTTVGSALVHLLEDQTGPTIAIKPRSNYRWHLYADDFLNWDLKHELMSCSDTLKLNAFSSIFRQGDVELAAPCQFISSSQWKSCLFVRCGSAKTKNRQLFLANENASELSFAAYGDGCYPFSNEELRASTKFNAKWSHSHKWTQEFIERSVTEVAKLNPTNIVFEGAGPTVPTWRNEHVMQNIVLVSNFTVYVFKGINAVVNNSSDQLTDLRNVVPFLRNAKSAKAKLRVVAKNDRHHEAYNTLAKLLEF